MVTKNFFQQQWKNIALVVALITMWLLVGISIWYAIVFLLFFWSRGKLEGKPAAYRALSVAMLAIVLLALLNVGVNKILPRTAAKKVPTMAFIDQMFSKQTPSETKVRAQDIFDQNYKDASKIALQQFEALVKEEKVEEAAKLLQDFEKKWSFKPFQKEEESDNQISQTQQVRPADIQDLVLYSGSYYIDVNGTSSNIIIKAKPGLNRYSIEPFDGIYDYQILMDGETVPVKDGPSVKLPSRLEPKFKIITSNNFKTKRIKIVVK